MKAARLLLFELAFHLGVQQPLAAKGSLFNDQVMAVLCSSSNDSCKGSR